ncbi:type VI secretion system receptor/chaperone Hcp [soil metagenome]
MSKGDMFLRIETLRGGVVAGESKDSEHPGEIDIEDWSWGMRSTESLAGSGVAIRTSLSELRIVKKVDCASPALMSVMRNNDAVRRAVLSCRKSGGLKPLDYFTIVVESGRLTMLDVGSGSASGPHLTESWCIAFEKIAVTYKTQDDKGGAKAASTFTADIR